MLPTTNISSSVNTHVTVAADAKSVSAQVGAGAEPVAAVAPIVPTLRAEGREDRTFPSKPRSDDGSGQDSHNGDGNGSAAASALSSSGPPPSSLAGGAAEVARLSVVSDPFDPLRPVRAANAYATGLLTVPGVAGLTAGTVIDLQG